MKKILSVLAVVFLIASLFVPLVAAVEVAIDGVYGAVTHNASWYIKTVHPSAAGANSAIGQSFTANATKYLTEITVYMYKAGTPTGALQASVCSIQGTYGTGSLPLTVIENSSYVSTTSLQGSWLAFNFSFSGATELTSGNQYGFYIYGFNDTINSLNYVLMGLDSTASSSGNAFRYINGAWGADSTKDLLYIVYGDSETGSPTPTPTPAASSTSTGDEDIENLTAIILPWLVPLLICLIPALLGYKFVGELGFFIGLNVGVILAYVTLMGTAYAFPLWGIILVGVMDVAVVLMRR